MKSAQVMAHVGLEFLNQESWKINHEKWMNRKTQKSLKAQINPANARTQASHMKTKSEPRAAPKIERMQPDTPKHVAKAHVRLKFQKRWRKMRDSVRTRTINIIMRH